MDQSLLVKNGHRLIEVLDKTKFQPRFALWFHDFEIDVWLLWIVPTQPNADKLEFYRFVSTVLLEPGNAINLSPSAVRLMRDDHPAVRALTRMSKVFGVTGEAEVSISHNMLDGFFLEEGILIRLLANEPEATAA